MPDIVKLLPGWRLVTELRYQRSDGAIVMWDDRTPYANPAHPDSQMWTVWEPDPGVGYLARGRRDSRLNWPRRFKTAGAAMKACERQWPLQVSATVAQR